MLTLVSFETPRQGLDYFLSANRTFLNARAFELSLRRVGRCGSGGPSAFQAV